MRVCLLYSERAGDGISSARLRGLLAESGHELMHLVDKDDDLEQVLDDSIELVVAAGGDGTVRRAASALAGRDVPLAVLPLGTANNIAKSLGIKGNARDMIARWSRARSSPLDLGVLHGTWGESRFIEGVGAGLVPGGIAAMLAQTDDDDEGTDSRLDRALRSYLDILSRLKPRRWTLSVDGARVDGAFLLVEALNMRSVGPNLVVSADVDPADGLLSVVTAGEEHRAALTDYLQSRLAGRETRLRLPTRRAKQIEIGGLHEIHVDDEVRHWPSMGTVSIGIEVAAIRVLV